jgi:hypothetical protein
MRREKYSEAIQLNAVSHLDKFGGSTQDGC